MNEYSRIVIEEYCVMSQTAYIVRTPLREQNRLALTCDTQYTEERTTVQTSTDVL